MHISATTVSNGVSEHLFSLGEVTGVLWTPASVTGPRPLLLMAHGGGQHKRHPAVMARAHRYVTARGYDVVVLDAPGHGDRPRTERDHEFAARLGEMMVAREAVGPHIADHNGEVAEQAVPEWQATLRALGETGRLAPQAPVGFWGLSLGSAIGLPLVAREPRVTAAVLGLIGDHGLAVTAAQVTIPVEFLVQWDDEMVPRSSALALFDTLASREKTLHASPGPHGGVPTFEQESSERFFARHLG